ILVSDHGEDLGEGGHYGHNINLEDHQIKVPLVIKYPGQREPAVVKEVVSQLDLFPTIADVVGAKPPAGLSGRSLRGGPESDGVVPSESYVISNSWGKDLLHRFDDAVELRLIAAVGRRDYSLNEENLREREEPFAGALNRYLSLRRQAVGKGTRGKAPTKEALEKLRSLGYL
ncbi:MAG TPA: sulfatase-like hydrolase/transferase, partial [Candidatus Aminicenantes bacterium]|nr:sulfatase-like hydrolase/transferase [Candidatus Aminicenantes bacterium]